MAELNDEYQPFFCHNCGVNLNPIEDYDDKAERAESKCNCGWCGRYHSIDRVKECAKLARLSDQALFKGTIDGLLGLRDRVQP